MRISPTSGGTTRNYVLNYPLGVPSVATGRSGGSDVRYYVYLPDGTLLHSIEAAGGQRRFYHFDEAGNTVFLTDHSGSSTDTYGISPFGEAVGPAPCGRFLTIS